MFSLLDSPIAQAELAHQRGTGQWHRFRDLVALVYGALLMISLSVFLAELVGALLGQGGLDVDRRPLMYILFVAALIVHFSAVLQTLVLSSNAINREKRGGTWDTLLITRVDAGQLVVGKWWATVRRMWPSFLAAGALRLGLVVWLGIEVQQQGGFLNLVAIYLNPFEILLATGAVLLLSVVNSGVTAAFGILASLLTQRSGRALVTAAVMRTFVLLFLSGGLWITSDLVRQIESDDPAVWIVSASATSLLDSASQAMAYNGSLLAAGLAGGTAPRPMGDIQYVVYVVIPLALYLLLTWALLWMAQRVAVRQGAYQPTRYERLRPRKKKKTDALVVPE